MRGIDLNSLDPLSDKSAEVAAFQERYKYDPVAFVHDCIDFGDGGGPTPYQDEIMGAMEPGVRVSVRSPHGAGKCLAHGEDVLLATGEWVRAESLIGKSADVPAVGRDLDPMIAEAIFTDNGIRDVVEIVTDRRRVIRRTTNHPLWADNSPYRWDNKVYDDRLRPVGRWIEAGDIEEGAVVAVVDSALPYQPKPAPEAHIKVAAYLIGDGGLSDIGVKFTNADDVLIEDLRSACEDLDCEVRRESDTLTYRIVASDSAIFLMSGRRNNTVLGLVRHWGLHGKTAHEKRFPDWVWRLPRRQLALFLSRLYACDGWASCSSGREIGYATVSDGLARDVSRALLRLGINASIHKKRTKWESGGEVKHGTCYQIIVKDVVGCLAFIDRIGIFGKRAELDALYESCWSAKRGKMQHWRSCNLPAGYHWERVQCVRDLGPQPTVAVSVPGPETFLTEFVEHNSSLASWLVIWGVLTADDCKVITTASAWRQLTHYLWPEIHKWWARLRRDKVPTDLLRDTRVLTRHIKRPPSCEAFAVASTDGALIEGAHAHRIIYLFDEAKAVIDEIWDSAEGAFSTAGADTGDEAYALAISTPGPPIGRFWEIQTRKPGLESWWVRHVTLEEAIEAGRISRHWAEERARQWGEKSALYRNRVLGEFAEEEGGLIPINLVEDAVEIWREWEDQGFPGKYQSLGVDVGRGGDQTIIAVCYQDGVRLLHASGSADLMETTGLVKRHLKRHGDPAVVDVIGIGAGVVDRLREQGHDVIAFNASEGTDETDESGELEFRNLRAAAWWKLMERLRRREVALPDDPRLIGELCAVRQKDTSSGKVQIESKREIVKRLGRSTDRADAVVMGLTGFDLVESSSSKLFIAEVEGW